MPSMKEQILYAFIYAFIYMGYLKQSYPERESRMGGNEELLFNEQSLSSAIKNVLEIYYTTM